MANIWIFFIQQLLYFFIVAGCVATLTGGCIPGVFYETINESLSGRIVNGQGHAVPGVSIVWQNGMKAPESFTPNRSGWLEPLLTQVLVLEKRTLTNANGEFTTGALRYWFYLCYLGGIVPNYRSGTFAYPRVLIRNGNNECYGIFFSNVIKVYRNDEIEIYLQYISRIRGFCFPLPYNMPPEEFLGIPPPPYREFPRGAEPLRIELEPELILLLDEGF